jgi:heme exporter protein A
LEPVPIIEARELTRRFGAHTALDAVDLTVREGESVAVFGPNGAGKTTLSRILTTSLKPSSGTLRIAGQDPRDHELETKRILGVISHQTFLYDDLSGLENLIFFAGLYGVERPEERAEALLASVGLEDRAGDAVRTYSRGMQQRLSLARSLIHNPHLVFLDEPFTGLDPQAATMLRETLERLRREGRTIFMVTHNLSRGLELSHRWIVLRRGRIVGEGTSAGTNPAAFERTYVALVAGGAAGPGMR